MTNKRKAGQTANKSDAVVPPKRVRVRKTANSVSAAISAEEETTGENRGGSRGMAGLLMEAGVEVDVDELDDSEEEDEEEINNPEEAVGPQEMAEKGRIRGVDPENPNNITHDDMFRVDREKFDSYTLPEDINSWPDEPTLLCKYKLTGKIHQLSVLSSENLCINFFFNEYLSTKVPDTDGYYLELSVEPSKLKFIPNSTQTKFFGIAECIRDKSMIPHSRLGPTTLTPDQISLFDKPEHCLAFRFVLVFPPEENWNPRLAIRVIRRTQTDAQAFINTLDIPSMSGGSFSLNTIKANGINQADGVPYNLYYNFFTKKPCSMKTYAGLLQGTIGNFLKMIYNHRNHSLSSYAEADKDKKSGNTLRFKNYVRNNDREPLASRINDQGNRAGSSADQGTQQARADLFTQAEKEMRLQNSYRASRPDGSGFPALSALNPLLNPTDRRTQYDNPTPSPALTRDKRPTNIEDTVEEESEEDFSEEENQSPPTKEKPRSQASKTPKKRSSSHTTDKSALVDITNLAGLNLYTALLTNGQIGSKSTIQTCKTLGLNPQDLAIVFPNVDLPTLSQPAGLFLSLKDLGDMNRSAQAKTSSSSKINREILNHNLSLVTQPREFPQCFDDLSAKNTSLRVFQRLPLMTMQELFMMDAKLHQDLRPIAAYNLSDINGAACITDKGWADAHNPGNPRVSIKEYMTRNINPNQGKNMFLDESLMLVDTTGGREADTVKELRLGWSLFGRVMRITHPAMLNYHTMDCFLIEKDFFYHEDRKGLAQAVFGMHFIDYYLAIISECYCNINPPPTKHDLDGHLRSFKDSIAGPSRANTQNQGNNSRENKKSGKGRGDNKSKNESHNDGITCCKYFNFKSGCSRAEDGGNFCIWKGVKHEHKCNFLFKFNKRCLKQHCAATNHTTA